MIASKTHIGLGPSDPLGGAYWNTHGCTNPKHNYLTALWVKSHCVGNAHANTLADKGGKLAEPSADDIKALPYWAEVLGLVQKGLLAIMMYLSKVQPRVAYHTAKAMPAHRHTYSGGVVQSALPCYQDRVGLVPIM